MKEMPSIDINCDMGESYGRYQVGNDDDIFPFITSCNIACGFHGGDPVTIERTIRKALEHGVNIGAHPSYPDLSGFGRRKMVLSEGELKSLIKYQVAAIKGITESLGGKVTYVKPHGALYNSMVKDGTETLWVCEALKELDEGLMLMGLAGSSVENICKEQNVIFIPEAFADRIYEKDGTLRSRNKDGSVIHDPAVAAQQVISIIKDHKVTCFSGDLIELSAQSICIHGDNPQAGEILKSITEELSKNEVVKKSFVS